MVGHNFKNFKSYEIFPKNFYINWAFISRIFWFLENTSSPSKTKTFTWTNSFFDSSIIHLILIQKKTLFHNWFNFLLFLKIFLFYLVFVYFFFCLCHNFFVNWTRPMVICANCCFTDPPSVARFFSFYISIRVFLFCKKKWFTFKPLVASISNCCWRINLID